MPKVLLDLRMVRGRMHGIARYAVELARQLPALAPGWEFACLGGVGGPPARSGFLSPFEQLTFARDVARSGCDLFHATSFSVPRGWRGPLVATLHDANHLRFPGEFGLATSLYYRAVVRPTLRRARAVLTVSEFSRRELAQLLPFDPARVEVIPLGVDARFGPQEPARLAQLRARRGLPERYLAVVANPKPHKNLALAAQVAQRTSRPFVLLAGSGVKGRFGFPAQTVELSELSEEELPLLYAGAEALLLPSRYEGFGLPALEAMACGCPVVASRCAPFTELLAGAASFASPDSPEEWVQVLEELAVPSVRVTRSRQGLAHAAGFTWRKTAERTLEVYRRVLGN